MTPATKATIWICASLAAVVGIQATTSRTSHTPPTATPTVTYRVVGTGDSILYVVALNNQLYSNDRWIDVEAGRQVDIPGTSGRYTTAQIRPILVAKSRPGGWIIIEDDAAQVTPERWRQMLQAYVKYTPDDRCLLGVLPYTSPGADPVRYADSQVKALIMRQELMGQPCRQVVRWDVAAANHPTFLADGLHPTPSGSAWLARAIDSIVGYRVNS